MPELAAYLARAYDHNRAPGAFPDPAAECIASVSRAELAAKLAELQPVLVRCHISRVHAKFLERVLQTP